MKKRPATRRTKQTVSPAASTRAKDVNPTTPPAVESPPAACWTFLTNHSHVLILLARNPPLVLREVAARVGITERAVQRIIADLEEGGYVRRVKVGRQNEYELLTHRPLRHPVARHRTIGDLLQLVNEFEALRD